MNRQRRGMTMIELVIAFVITSILALGSFTALLLLTAGIDESRADNAVQSRLEIVRQLISLDVRAGELINFPATNGAGGTYAEGADNGEYCDLNINGYDPSTQAFVPYRVRWESRRNGGTGQYTINRRLWTGGAWSANPFQVKEVDTFEILRQSDNRLDFTATALSSSEQAEIQFTLTLRNFR